MRLGTKMYTREDFKGGVPPEAVGSKGHSPYPLFGICTTSWSFETTDLRWHVTDMSLLFKIILFVYDSWVVTSAESQPAEIIELELR